MVNTMQKKHIHFDSALEAKVFSKIIKQGFNESPYSVKQEPLFQYSNNYYRPDFVIYKQDKVWALIEVASLAFELPFTHAKDRLNQLLFTTGAFFAVITDGKSYHIKKGGDCANTSDYEEISEKDFVQRLKGDLQLTKNDSSQQNIRLIIKEIAPDIANSEAIQFDSDGNVSFTKSEEQSFFEKILSINEKTIYRYVSFETLFQTIKNKTYRMLGLAGMNDRTELNYFDNFLGKVNEVDNNNKYISSCSLLKDDLTMWRLYGDDGRGVCLAFNVHDVSSCFHLYKVDYGDEPKKHKHLDVIKRLHDNGFVFNDSEIWKRFFKPYEFSSEEEVRLLFIDDFTNKSIGRDWVKTFDNSIINPVIDFPLTESSFPLQLSEIILGPKFPEEVLNSYQLNQMLKSRGIKINNIEPSTIKCYR